MKRKRNVVSDCHESCEMMLKQCEASSIDADQCADKWEQCVSECFPSS